MKVKAVTACSLHNSGHVPFEGITCDGWRVSTSLLLHVVAMGSAERHVARLRELLEVHGESLRLSLARRASC